MKFKKFVVKNYRSLLDVEISLDNSSPISICGENNIGKTNLLRALNVFFNHINDENLFKPEVDIPFHIYRGSRGSGTKTELTGFFEGETTYKIFVKFNSIGEVSYQINDQEVAEDEVKEFLGKYHFIFIEASNINIPSVISAILETKGLLPLDKKRKTQSDSLKKLEEFINLSKIALRDIENKINDCFKEFTNFNNSLKDKRIIINFIEFQKLRDAIKNMTSLTLEDGNNHDISIKGSGTQRAILLAIMKFISENNVDKSIIWGIDEPEAFLQPKFQKKVFSTLKNMCDQENQDIILTTHSQHFIDLKRLDNSYLFIGETSLKEYQRRPGKTFTKIDTKPKLFNSNTDKIKAIKDHLGVENNDGWELLPCNLLVEGETDKKYLELIFNAFNVNIPYIKYSGGASLILGYLQYYNTLAENLSFSPKVICLFDYDEAGKEQLRKLSAKKVINLELIPMFINKNNTNIKVIKNNDKWSFQDNKSNWEIEDFISPELIFRLANMMLKNRGYKEISSRLTSTKEDLVYKEKSILECLDIFSRQVNTDKESFLFNTPGRKLEMCNLFCTKIPIEDIKSNISECGKKFIEDLSGYFE